VEILNKYGTISPVPTTDNLIYKCFEQLTEADQRSFVRKFKEQLDDVQQVNHTLRELVLGAYIAGTGFKPQYEPRIDGETPEWLMTQDGTGKKLIIELVNFHLPDRAERQMWDTFTTGWMWAHWMEPNTPRAYSSIQRKMAKYKALAENNTLPYVVGVFGLFSSALTIEEVRECLEGPDALFPLYPEVSGVVFFQGVGGEYHFEYLPNPFAKRKGITLSAGSMPVEYVEKSPELAR
jgi:hypothetical protein